MAGTSDKEQPNPVVVLISTYLNHGLSVQEAVQKAIDEIPKTLLPPSLQPHRTPSHRVQLMSVGKRLEMLSTQAAILLAAPGDLEVGALAERLVDLIADMQAKVKEKLRAK